MLKTNVARLAAGIFCALALAGCGSGGGSDTNGTLGITVVATDSTARSDVLTTVIYTPSTSSSTSSTPQGVPIRVVTSIHTLTGTPTVITENLATDSSGTVTSLQHVAKTTEPIYVDVTASTGGLSSSQSATIPSL